MFMNRIKISRVSRLYRRPLGHETVNNHRVYMSLNPRGRRYTLLTLLMLVIPDRNIVTRQINTLYDLSLTTSSSTGV